MMKKLDKRDAWRVTHIFFKSQSPQVTNANLTSCWCSPCWTIHDSNSCREKNSKTSC